LARGKMAGKIAEPDELYTLRNRFWIGQYQMAVSEGNSMTRIPERLRDERDEFVFRSYIAMGQPGVVLNELSRQSKISPGLQVVKILAQYFANPNSRQSIVASLNDLLQSNDPSVTNNPNIHLIASIIFQHEGNTNDAIRVIYHGLTMEQNAMLVQLYLRMNRIDLAQNQLKLMQQVAEDATLTQLASAWVNLSTGGQKIQEAVLTYEELINKFGNSSLLLNGLGVALMQSGRFEEAEKILLDAASQNPSDADTLINMISCLQNLDKTPEVIDRYFSQLQVAAPNHPFVLQFQNLDNIFERQSAQLSFVQNKK